ncbi:MAG: glycosyltransferase family 2 protein [Deltaproteobacteria bacterium]|nr:glycosyltransferase family 2 protein [Deltaproteobacteria bacterium]
MGWLPTVTIVMPCLQEARYIEACLGSVRQQDYPADKLEILVTDGGSRDGTREIIARVAAEDPRVAMVDNPDRLQAPGMNAAIRRARGEVLVRMDVHCEYAPDYVRRCVEALDRTGADNVGGAQRPRAHTPFQRALCAALQSPLGVGNARYRSAGEEGFVDTVFLGAFRRRVFERVGLYDPGAATNEDAELNQRIIAAGGRVFLSKEIVVHYYPRASFAALARQYYRYGQGRARTVAKHGRLLSVRPVLPAVALVLGAALLLTWPVQPLTPWALGLYAAGTFLEAVRVGRGGGLRQLLTTWAIFPVIVASHGAGFLAGAARYLRQRDWGEPERLPPRDPAAA